MKINKAYGKILRIINKLRDSIKLWEEYEELSKQEELFKGEVQ